MYMTSIEIVTLYDPTPQDTELVFVVNTTFSDKAGYRMMVIVDRQDHTVTKFDWGSYVGYGTLRIMEIEESIVDLILKMFVD